ncbi:MAG: response regulator transcription factor [Cyclobacteriaceae bacterium]|nr:response regulator transcription factor [Cyclobacteriaceae bacterium]
MMKVIIIEDEDIAIRKLKNILKSVDPAIQILASLESVKDAVSWIRHNPEPDLGFVDIQLSDDISFEIFKQCEVNFPVVFVTAYDDYLLRAFDHNAIHYLLKPVTVEKISLVLDKLKKIENHFVNAGIRNFLLKGEKNQGIKKRLVVKKGVDFAPLDVENIAYFFIEHKISFVRDQSANTYTTDDSLAEIESTLDPGKFFRVNRQYIVRISAIKKFSSIEYGKIRLQLEPPTGEDVIIGKENAIKFRKWIRGG